MNISGGVVGDGLIAYSGSGVTISGGNFRLDGVSISGLETVGSTAAFNITRSLGLKRRAGRR